MPRSSGQLGMSSRIGRPAPHKLDQTTSKQSTALGEPEWDVLVLPEIINFPFWGP